MEGISSYGVFLEDADWTKRLNVECGEPVGPVGRIYQAEENQG